MEFCEQIPVKKLKLWFRKSVYYLPFLQNIANAKLTSETVMGNQKTDMECFWEPLDSSEYCNMY